MRVCFRNTFIVVIWKIHRERDHLATRVSMGSDNARPVQCAGEKEKEGERKRAKMFSRYFTTANTAAQIDNRHFARVQKPISQVPYHYKHTLSSWHEHQLLENITNTPRSAAKEQRTQSQLM